MSGVSNIVSFGFGSWSGVEYVPTLGFGGNPAAGTTPSYYHAVEGPSRKLKTLEGATTEPHVLEGPSQKLRQLTGCN